MSARRVLPRVVILALLATLAVWVGCGQNVSASSAPYNQDAGRSGADRFGRQTNANERGKGGPNATVGGSTLTLGLKVTMDDIYGKDSQFKGNTTQFLEWAARKGFGALGIYVVDPTSDPDATARFWFEDVAFADGTKLSDHGYAAAGTNVAELIAAAKQAGLGVQVDLTRFALSYRGTTLAPRPFAGDSLDAKQIGALCTYLCEQAGADSVTGRGFPGEWLAEAGKACQAADRVFFAGDAAALRSADLAAAAPLDRGPATLATSELAMARARSSAYMLWAGVTAERRYAGDSPFGSQWASLKDAQSALAYRTIESAPQGLFLDMPPAAVDKLDAGTLESLKRYAAMRSARPVCALVLLGDSLPRNLGALVNGVSSAGYSLALGTAGTPLHQADAVYVLATRKADGSMPELPKDLTDGTFNAGKVCVLQLCGPLPSLGSSASWDAVRRSFGVGDAEMATIEAGPTSGTYAGTEVPCAETGASPWGILLTKEGLSQAEPLLVGEVPDSSAGADSTTQTRSVVVVSRFSYGSTGQNVLINGAELAPEMAYPISQALGLGKGLQGPTRVLCSVGSPVALFAPEGGYVKLVYDDNGQPKTVERDLKKGELYVAEVAKQSAVSQLPAGDRPRR